MSRFNAAAITSRSSVFPSPRTPGRSPSAWPATKASRKLGFCYNAKRRRRSQQGSAGSPLLCGRGKPPAASPSAGASAAPCAGPTAARCRTAASCGFPPVSARTAGGGRAPSGARQVGERLREPTRCRRRPHPPRRGAAARSSAGPSAPSGRAALLRGTPTDADP